jgi:hypothetical protein
VAAALAAHEKTHVEHCPHCRRVIKIPVEQLRRALPIGWSPPAVLEQAAPNGPQPAAQAAAPADMSSDAAPPPGAAAPGAAGARSKSPTGKTAAEKPAARKSARKQPKP